MNNIYLIGIMGCGKTTIGKIAAEILQRDFFDVDCEIEVRQKMIIRDIFAQFGENYFREIESDSLKELSNKKNTVLSTGGGIVLRDKNIDIMRSTGKIIWIKRCIEDIVKQVETDTRPIIRNNPQRLYDIYAQREAIYKECADFMVCNDSLPEDAAQKIADYMLR